MTSPDDQAYADQCKADGERYLRTLLSKPQIPARVRAELAQGIKQLNERAKLAILPAHLDCAES